MILLKFCPSYFTSTNFNCAFRVQDKAGAEESNRRAAAVVRESLAPLLPNPPEVTAGEVVAHKAT